MEKLFLAVLHMSVTASAAILAVLLARLALGKAPKVFSYALWAVVLFRLLCPFALESRFALLSNNIPIRSVLFFEIEEASRPEPDNGTASAEDALPVEPVSSQGPAAQISAAPNRAQMAGGLWLSGAAAMLGYGVWSVVKLRRKLVGFAPLEGEKDVRLVDHIPSPFVLGLLSPKIYLPSDLPRGEQDYILLHERTHIRRMDHMTRALAWLALAVHWFNPLVWLAFYLAGKDMEMSCDETVLRKMGRDIRTDYSSSLLRLSAGGSLPAGPLAFGGGDLKGRIENILHYKKPALWVPVLAFAAVLIMGAMLATDPGELISPASVTSYTQISATSSHWHNTIVYTAADRRQDLLHPMNSREMSREEGDELVRLVNSYRRTVYSLGEQDLNGPEHHLYRISCADGGYYLVDYWYWNGFSFHPLHLGEDDYTTLVTHYDAEGNAGITWQMEYNFDLAIRDWRKHHNQLAWPLGWRT